MKKLLLILSILICFIATANAQVAVYWRGEATNGNWEWGSSCDGGSDGNWYYATWGGNRKRPDCYANHYIHFDNNNQTTMLLNAGSDFNVAQILFDASATSARTINSTDYRKIQFNAATSKVENYSTAAHTFYAEFVLNGTTEINPINGNLNINGSVYTNGNTINVYGSNGKTLTLGAPVSGTGNLYVKQNTTVVLSAVNTYTGTTQVEAGTLVLNNNSGALPSNASLTVLSGATLKVSKNQTLASVNVQSGGTLVIDAGATLTVSNSYVNAGTLQKNGTLILLMSDTVYWRGEAANGNWDWGTTCDNGTDGNWYYVGWGGNRKRPDCYGGKLVHIDNNAQTTMALNSNDDFSVIQLTFDTSATSPHTISSPVGRRIFMKPGATSKIENYSSATHTINAGLGLENDSELNPINGNLTLGNIETFGYAIRVYGNNNKTLTVNGVISGSGTLTVKQNTTVELSGANTLTGALTVEAGTLVLNNNSGAVPTTASITVNSGATLKIASNQTLAAINLQSGANLIIDAGAVLTLTGSVPTTGTLVNNGTLRLNIAGSNLTFPTGITVSAMNGLDVAAGTISLNTNITPNLLTVSGGVLDLGTHTANAPTGSSSFTLSSGTLKIGGTNTLPSGFGTYSISSGTTTQYYGTTQEIVAPGSQKYGNLILSGTGQKTLAANTGVANDLTIGTTTSLLVSSGKSLTVDNRVINNGTATSLIIEDNAALVQTNNVANTGQLMQYKNGNSLYRLDYTLWSSPVQGQNLLDFSPGTTATRFYEYRYGTNSANTQLSAYFHVDPATDNFTAGKGYLIRMPNSLPSVTGYDAGTGATSYSGTFTGTPNNGTITLPVSAQGDYYTSVGNPYPSPISITAFFNQNSSVINGTLYLWRKKNGSSSSSYATLTTVAYTANGGGTNSANSIGGQNASGYFNGDSNNWVLAPGQGFLVQTKNTVTGTPVVTFNNSMRRAVPGAGQAFLRTTAGSMARMWLNITDAGNAFSQAALVYTEGATTGIDYAMDGLRFKENNTADIYTLAEEEQLAVQARPEFAANDVVKLGFTAPQAGNYIISLDRAEGIFNSGQSIYLYDRTEGIIRELHSHSYEFTSEAGSFNDRFEIRYNTTILNNILTGKPEVSLYRNTTGITINSGNAQLKNIAVYDLNGRLLYDAPALGNASTISLSSVVHQVLIVQVATDKGIVSKKLVY
jgi:autotransporter-associated beta strand protein